MSRPFPFVVRTAEALPLDRTPARDLDQAKLKSVDAGFICPSKAWSL
jgi:hypothetical protein